MEDQKKHSYGQLGVGIFLFAAGIALMLDKFDIIQHVQVWHYWPLIILAIGLGKLLDAQFGWEYRKAFSTLFIGSWLLLCELQLFGLRYHTAWPLLLIGIGISMLWKSAYPSHFKFVKDHCHGQ